MPGVACLVASLGVDMTLSVFKAGPLLEEGLALPDLRGFLETPTGAEYVKENSQIVTIAGGCSIYLPFGLVPILSYICLKEQETTWECRGGAAGQLVR